MIKRLRFYLALISAILKKDRRKISLGLVSVLLLLFILKVILPTVSPQITSAYKESRKPTFVEGVVGKPVHPNPLFDKSETQKEISQLVFRGLMKVDKKGNPVGDLAKNFKKISGTEYIFYLKKDIFWHDGARFTSDDVIYTVKTAQDPQYESVVSSNFKDVLAERLDDYTVKFKLREPFAPFPFATTVGIIPKHVPLKKYKPIGTGSFKVKSIAKDKIILSSKQLNLVFRFYKNFKDAKTALKLGEIHALGGFTPQEVSEMEKFGGKNIYQHVLPYRQTVVFFNTKSDPLKSRGVRQALAYSINKAAVGQSAGGKTAVISKNQLPLISWAENGKKDRYELNLVEAKKLLKEAGFEFTKNSWQKKGKKLAVSIISADDSELNTTVNMLKESWIQLGIKAKSKTQDVESLHKEIVPNRDFQILVDFQEIPPDPDQYVLWHTTQVRNANITGISSANLDKLLEDARKVGDVKKRGESYKLFTTLLADEAPAVFLYYPQYIWVVSKKVHGIDLSNFTTPLDRFDSYKKWRVDRGYF